MFEQGVIYRSHTSGASKIHRLIKQQHAREIPIFGSSRAERHYVPSMLSSECYNYGIAATQANIWLYMLEQELKKAKTTPVIINFDLNGLIYSNGDIANYLPNLSETKHLLKNRELKLQHFIPFIKYYGQYEKYIRYYFNEKMSLTKEIDNGGSFEKNKITQSKFEQLIAKRKNTETEFVLDAMLAEKFISLLEKTDRKKVIVISPYHPSYFEELKNTDDIKAYFNRLAKMDNVCFINLSKMLDEDRWFFNTTHLNYEGARKFTETLKRILAKNDIAPWSNITNEDKLGSRTMGLP
jgi:hypothetical protein